MAGSSEVVLYTDGACSGNPGPGGWAAILHHPATGKKTELSGGEADTTNNRMELAGVIEGLRKLNTSKRRRVHVVTDSQYVVFGMTQWIEGWMARGWRRGSGKSGQPVKNVDLWKTLHALCQEHEVTFEHVKGHAGHPENEACDRLAVAAIEAVRRG